MLESAAAILFVPRQVTMLKSHTQAEDNNKRAAAAAAPAPAPEKKDKKRKKKRSSETLDGAPPAAGTVEPDAPNRKAREALLNSITAFLESNGFSKTLAVFRSEAQLPPDGGKASFPNLEDLVCKFLESSTNSEDAVIDLQKEQDSEKVVMHKMDASKNDLDALEHTHRNKKKNSEDKNLKELKTSGDETDSKKSVLAEAPHVKTKDKKKKKKPAVLSLGENHSEGSHGTANTDHENDFQDHLVDEKEKRKKKQKASSDPSDGKSEFVDNVKFRKLVEEKAEELNILSSTPPAESNSKQKHEKRKKTKKSSDDSGKENALVEENTDDLKISKKRKRSASEERASLPENVVETKDSKHVRIEGTDSNKEVGTHQNIDRSIPDNENLPISKKRKKEKSKEGSTKNVKTSINEQLNGLADNKVDTGASQKESKERKSSEFAAFREEAARHNYEATDDELWYEYVGGHNNKHRVSGVGDYERELRPLKSSSSQSSYSQSSQVPRMNINDDSAEIAELLAQNEKIMEENRLMKEKMDAMESTQLTILEQLRLLTRGSFQPPPGPDDDGMGGSHGMGVV